MHWARPPQPRVQRVLLPPLVEELVGLHHPARVLDKFLDMVDRTPFERICKHDVRQPPIPASLLVSSSTELSFEFTAVGHSKTLFDSAATLSGSPKDMRSTIPPSAVSATDLTNKSAPTTIAIVPEHLTEFEKPEQIQKAIAATKKTGRRKTNEDSPQSAEPAMAAQTDAVKTTTAELPIEVASKAASDAAESKPVASTVANSKTNPEQSIDENNLRRAMATVEMMQEYDRRGNAGSALICQTKLTVSHSRGSSVGKRWL